MGDEEKREFDEWIQEVRDKRYGNLKLSIRRLAIGVTTIV